MFGGNKKNESKSAMQQAASNGNHALNSVVKGTKMEGDIHAESDFRVDGNIKGNLNCKARVIIGPSGSVEGHVSCQNAVIEGHFSGELKVQDSLTVKEQAVIDGDVFTNKLIVSPGAVFNVVCTMKGGTHQASKNTEAAKVNAAKA